MRTSPFSLAVLAFAAIGFAFAAGPAQAQSDEGIVVAPEFAKGLVRTEKDGYVVLSSELVAGPGVRLVAAAPDGRHLLLWRETRKIAPETILDGGAMPEGEASLLLWNSRSRKTVTLWKRPLPAGTMLLAGSASWFSTGGGVISASFYSPGGAPRNTSETIVLTLNLAGAFAKAVSFPSSGFVVASPTQSYAAVITYSDDGIALAAQGKAHITTCYFLPSNGVLGKAVPLAQGDNLLPAWTANGKHLFLVRRSAEDKGKPAFFAFDPKTGAITPTEERFQPRPEEKNSLPLFLGAQPKGKTGEAAAVFLSPSADKTGKEGVALSVDGKPLLLLPDLAAALYLVGDSVFAAPLLRVDGATLDAAKEKAQVTATLSRAKQIAVALHMYAQDYDENFPSSEGFSDKIAPYLKDSAMLNGFVYQPGTLGLAEIKEPATTVIGHLPGPGGRAVVYADGHVKWQPDK